MAKVTTAEQTKTQQTLNQAPQAGTNQIAVFHEPRLPYHPAIQERFGYDKSAWKALCESIFPGATKADSIVLALSYCKARKMDPFKRVVHIVPIWDKNKGAMVDTVWPGIAELRTTAFRTGQYAGKDDTVFGPQITETVGRIQMTYPEWAQVTVYRILNGQRCAFAGPKVLWIETYAVYKRDDPSPNSMWESRPYGQIEKCAEAAALRAAFPEEIGSEFIPEEVQSRETINTTATVVSRSISDGSSKSAALAEQLSEQWAPAETHQAATLRERILSDVAAAETIAAIEQIYMDVSKAEGDLSEDEKAEVFAAINARGAEITAAQSK